MKHKVPSKKVRCPYKELDIAYKRGKRDQRRGKILSDNPYPRIPISPSCGQYPFGAWTRGWLASKYELR